MNEGFAWGEALFFEEKMGMKGACLSPIVNPAMTSEFK